MVCVLPQVQWGEVMKLVGGHSSIGDWTAERAATMGWNDGHIWRTVLDLAAGQQVEFKVGMCSAVLPSTPCVQRTTIPTRVPPWCTAHHHS